jgi:hypothetical protein
VRTEKDKECKREEPQMRGEEKATEEDIFEIRSGRDGEESIAKDPFEGKREELEIDDKKSKWTTEEINKEEEIEVKERGDGAVSESTDVIAEEAIDR